MSDEESQGEGAALSEAKTKRESSVQANDSESVEKGGEQTDTEGMPEGGYEMAPTSNNPDRGSGDSGSDSDE